MKIFSADQVREADAYTIAQEPIPSIELMERAAEAFSEVFSIYYPAEIEVAVVCGTGNNGGDGLAVSRILKSLGYSTQTFIIGNIENGSEDFKINYHQLQAQEEPTHLNDATSIPSYEFPVIIDAIFGSGLTRAVTGLYAEVINKMNQSESEIVAIDIASGLFPDRPTVGGAIIEADHTVSFQFPKLSFMLPENHAYVGDWQVVDIGLHQDFIASTETKHVLVDVEMIDHLLHDRSKFDHKGIFGHGLLVGGSYGKMGAIVMAATAFLRSGAGLLTTHIPKCGYDIVQISVPEAMATTDNESEVISHVPLDKKYSAIGIGPGLGTSIFTQEALRQLLHNHESPLVIDADGINILAKHRELLEILPPQTILTPHIKEFERLAGVAVSDWDRLELLQSFSQQHNLVIVLKGSHTTTACTDGKLFFNDTGNPGMATGGSGDVLTGIITGLLAQGYEPPHAAIIGVYMHGLAGDIAVEDIGTTSLMATDIIGFLPAAFKKFRL
jgi:hydroxyethylthiazole kinase-like uncharacterized protein yjeF